MDGCWMICRYSVLSFTVSHSNPATVGRTLTLAGPSAYTVQEVIALCEKYADADAKVQEVPVWLLKLTRNVLKSFQWARDASDRLVRW